MHAYWAFYRANKSNNGGNCYIIQPMNNIALGST